tara:strand:- start:1211 stop:1483 length:273 start_codon:yes stop_codon:yes gene_type:complete
MRINLHFVTIVLGITFPWKWKKMDYIKVKVRDLFLGLRFAKTYSIRKKLKSEETLSDKAFIPNYEVEICLLLFQLCIRLTLGQPDRDVFK